MKLFFGVLVTCFTLSCAAEHRFGNWTYGEFSESAFELVEVDNGMFLQFEGDVEFESEYVIDISNPNPRLVIEVGNENKKLFPYLIRGSKQEVSKITLINSKSVVDEITKNKPKEFDATFYLRGKAKFKISKFNISADCGTANYFVFDAEVVLKSVPVGAQSVEDEGC